MQNLLWTLQKGRRSEMMRCAYESALTTLLSLGFLLFVAEPLVTRPQLRCGGQVGTLRTTTDLSSMSRQASRAVMLRAPGTLEL